MIDTAEHLSNRAYAKQRGVSEAVVRKWLSQGKIEKDPRTGKIDPAVADARLAENLSRLPNNGRDAKKNGDRKVNGKRLSLTEAQTKKVNAEAQLAELKLAEQQGSLVQRRCWSSSSNLWIKEGKYALHWTRLSCKRFVSNQVRLGLFVLAYNLGNFLRRLVLPRKIKHWSLRSLLVKLIKIGAKVVRHNRYTTFQMAAVAIDQTLFAEILARIKRLRYCSV